MSLSIDGMMSQYGEYLTSSQTSSTASADKLQSTLQSKDYNASSSDELMKVCKEFEAYFTEQVFKALEKMVPESDDSDNGTIAGSMSGPSYMDYFGDMLTQEYAASASESNGGKGLGLAQMLYEQMKRNYGIKD